MMLGNENGDSTIEFTCRLAFYTKSYHLGTARIKRYKDNKYSSVSIGYNDFDKESNLQIKNDLKVFLWHFILKRHEEKNDDKLMKLNNNINSIQSGLKSINRSNKLNDILNV